MEVEKELEAKEEPKKRTSSRSLSATEKRRLTALYETGELTQAQIDKAVGVQKYVISHLIMNYGVKKGA